MQSNLGRVVLGIAAIAVAVVLLIVLKDDGGDESSGSGTATERTTSETGELRDEPSKPAIPTIVVKNGKPVGGVEDLTVNEGDRIRFRVTSDASDEVHVHGYDIEKEVGPGGPASFDFPASIEGLFEAELHGSGEQIAELRVEP
jgi:hypothetical protein